MTQLNILKEAFLELCTASRKTPLVKTPPGYKPVAISFRIFGLSSDLDAAIWLAPDGTYEWYMQDGDLCGTAPSEAEAIAAIAAIREEKPHAPYAP